MAAELRAVDVVIVGLGWTGSLLALELADAGLNIVALERGPWRDTATDFPSTYAPDELRYAIRYGLFQQTAQNTVTFRNNDRETALPIRQWGSFLPGDGAGGAGVHWNGQTWRFQPSDFRLASHLTQRYGGRFLPADMLIQDWGISYAELEPHYDRFEKLCGTSGKAGNLNGSRQAGGNPFEGPRSSEYPTPPQRQPYGPSLFAAAAREMGYHPFPQPSSNLSQSYTNQLGVTLGQCSFCGFCERFGCGNYSKASPQTAILPALQRRRNVEMRTGCEVLRINRDSSFRRATGVTYVDAKGVERVQPAELVLLCAFSYNCVWLMMLSGIGRIHDPRTGDGNLGRNYAYQVTSGADLIFPDRIMNPFIGSGSIGMVIDEFNGDNFDHGPHGFVGGGYLGAIQTGARPIGYQPVPDGTPAWGAAWKRAIAATYIHSYQLAAHGSCYSYRGAHLDLDPVYTDRFGRPLLRMTFDFHANELRMSAFLTARLAEIGRRMGASSVTAHPRKGPYSSVPYQTTHNTGGAIMGTNPANSVVNKYLQCWEVPNLFVYGASVFPQNAGYNPTGTVAATTLFSADAIRRHYLRDPGPLVRA